jgi:nucleotide-binding universal stress UspA family protein
MDRRNDILVGVDGSAGSDAAVAWAVAEAAARGCGLLILHACESRYYGLWTTTRALRAGLRAIAQPIVDDALALAARADPAVPARGAVLVASPVRALQRLSDSAALVVIGRNGRGMLSRLLLGSVTQHLAANAGCPVIAVGCPPRGVRPGTVDRVVAAIDTPSTNEQTLRFAFAEALQRHAPLDVVHSVPHPDDVDPELHRLGVSLIAWRAEYPGVDVTPRASAGSLLEAVAAACKPRDLLVLGHHRHLPFAPHSLGARATSALHAAPCPVAVVHETLEAEARLGAIGYGTKDRAVMAGRP